MRIISVDTCLAACSVAIIDGERTLAALSEPMVRGHQERLATMVREAVEAAGIKFSDLDRIGVTVGPGSFTGLRVGLAFAKGLGSALAIPCVGIGSLQALAGTGEGITVACVDARRDQIYVQAFEAGRALMEPAALHAEDAAAAIRKLGQPVAILGSGAPLLAEAFPNARLDPDAVPDPVVIARLAARSDTPAAPLYLRAPDAKLPE